MLVDELFCRVLVRTNPDAIIVHDTEKVLYANPRACFLAGVRDQSSFVGNPIWVYLPGRDHKVIREKIGNLFAGNAGRLRHVHSLKRSDGAELLVETTSVLTQWGDERVIQSVMRDAPRRMRNSAAEVYAQDDRWRGGILDAMGEGVVVYRNNRILYANPAFLSLSGYSVDEVAGMSLMSCFEVSEDVMDERCSTLILSDRRGRRNSFRESVLRHRSGRQVAVLTADVMGEWYGVRSFLMFVHDLTPVRAGEREREELRRELARLESALSQRHVVVRDIVEQVARERALIEATVRERIEKDVMPLIGRLRRKSSSRDARCLDLLVAQLRRLADDSGLDSLSCLSIREREICNCIKEGLSTKEIADWLNISPRTIDRHRENIRKKLCLDRNRSLGSYLASPDFGPGESFAGIG